MKRGVGLTLRIPIECNVRQLKEAQFIFKAEESENAETLLKKTYKGVAEAIFYQDGCFLIELSNEESYFLPDGIIYIDSRITMKDGSILETGILKIRVKKTLFKIDD